MEEESLGILALGSAELEQGMEQAYAEDLPRIHQELASLTRTLRAFRARRIMDALEESASPLGGVEPQADAGPDPSQTVQTPAPTAATLDPVLDPVLPSSAPSSPRAREEDLDTEWGAPQEIELEALSRDEQRMRALLDEPQFGMEGW